MGVKLTVYDTTHGYESTGQVITKDDLFIVLVGVTFDISHLKPLRTHISKTLWGIYSTLYKIKGMCIWAMKVGGPEGLTLETALPDTDV